MSEKIKLAVAGIELVFAPNVTAYNKFINDMSMDNKVAPAVGYLNRIVEAESKEALAVLFSVRARRSSWLARLMKSMPLSWRLK
jgi:hypothetical protein